jgi:hypothetical protein
MVDRAIMVITTAQKMGYEYFAIIIRYYYLAEQFWGVVVIEY